MSLNVENRAQVVLSASAAQEAVAQTPRRLAPHLIELSSDGQWAAWRCIGLRGAGFPVDLLDGLSSAECSQAADRVLHDEEEIERIAASLKSALQSDLEQTLAAGGEPHSLVRAMRQLKKRRVPDPFGPEYGASRVVEEYRRAVARVAEDRERYAKEYTDAALRGARFIHLTARSPLFLEALTWQNRQAAQRAIHSLLKRQPGAALARQRRNEAMVAGYLQRYCTKNETIGFFGPVGWARFTSEGPALRQRPGAALLEQRGVYFEHWCIDALAERLTSDEELRRELKPRLMPYVRVEGGKLYEPLEEAVELSEEDAAVMEGCRDGHLSASELAAELVSKGVFTAEEEVYGRLENLCRRRLMTWSLEVPMQVRPEAALRLTLEQLPDHQPRRRALAALAQLEQARSLVAAAAGDPHRLDAALAHLEEVFTSLTDAPATRSAGRTYAGRTLVYEDCRRDIEVELGPELRQRLAAPLSLLLSSARWMTAEVAAVYREAFQAVYEQLSGGRGGAVEAVEFWMRAQRLIFGERGSLAAGVGERLRQRWQRVLGERLEECGRCVRYETEELRGRVEEEFGGVERGWRSGRYHSPDVMIAAEDEEAVRRGEYEMVLGEMHVGVNTLGAGSFVEQHPRPDELFEAVALDLPGSGVFPVTPKFFPKNTPRTNFVVVLPKDYYLLTTADVARNDGAGVLTIADLLVEPSPSSSSLQVRSRSRSLCFDIIDFFGEALNLAVVSSFRLLPPMPHSPRIYFDDLVVSRESWSLPAAEVEWTRQTDEAERFLAARRWQRRHGMPRVVFVKLPTEVKPFYVDFDSPAYVAGLGRAIEREVERGGGGEQVMSVTEMLPGVEQAWLRDGEGRRYTSELRIVAVDLSN